VRLEYRAGLKNIANTLMAKALQECPNSGKDSWPCVSYGTEEIFCGMGSVDFQGLLEDTSCVSHFSLASLMWLQRLQTKSSVLVWDSLISCSEALSFF
jgi:hypothetical protein